MPLLVAETGSFRDPSGRVYRLDDRILRSVNRRAVSDFEFVRSTGLIDELSEKNLVLPAKILQPTELNCEIPGAELVIEAPTIPFISFPYEWVSLCAEEGSSLPSRYSNRGARTGRDAVRRLSVQHSIPRWGPRLHRPPFISSLP
jgi:hypothetical protein